jgi:acetolactate synthase-1/2/3 large subunit
MNGADIVAEILRREGTEFLSCYPRNPLIEACAALDIRTILCRQERVGVGIADGFSRIRQGKQNGVFAAQHGPGIENAYPGVAQAFSENVPILVVPAGHPLDRQYIQPTFRAVHSYDSVLKWGGMALSVQELPDLLRRAYQAMRSGKGGPAMLEIPVEIWDQEFEGELSYKPVPVLRSAPDPDSVAEAARMLLAAKNPVLWAGQGVHYAGAGDALVQLAELIPAPVCTTNPGKSAIPENHPLALGASTRSRSKMFAEYIGRADVVMAIGSSLTKTSFGPGMPAGKIVIHATNDAGDINKDYAVDLGIVGDAALVIEALIEEIARQRGPAPEGALRDLCDGVSAVKKEWQEEWSSHFDSDEVPINQYRVIRDLMKTVDRDNVIITHDSGSPREQLLPTWETTRAHSYIGWGKSTQLGYGLPLAMGAKLAAPEKLCINLMGDASFGMTGLDIETAARNGIGTLTIVFNNGIMAAERSVLKISDEKFNSMDIGGNYAKVAEGLNVSSSRVDNPAHIVDAIREAVDVTESGRPFLLEFCVKEGQEFSRYS